MGTEVGPSSNPHSWCRSPLGILHVPREVVDMNRLANNDELELTPNFRLAALNYTFVVSSTATQNKAAGWVVAVWFMIFLSVMGPFFVYKLVLDDTYDIVSKSAKRR